VAIIARDNEPAIALICDQLYRRSHYGPEVRMEDFAVVVVRVHATFMVGLLSGLSYIVARVTLLVLPFVDLKSLAPEVYKTVEWTTFIPHV